MPRKLGQHFLKDRRALRKIAATLEIIPRDTIVEIGPGHGELTRELVNKFISLKISKCRIITIEKDPALVDKLKSSEIGKFIEVIEGDILKELEPLTSKLTAKPRQTRRSGTYKLCGNIPYYLTGFLFRKISELKNKPELIVFTIQKEVAERICARPPKMNLLAASVQFWSEPKIVGRISKKSFRPTPKMDSAIIKITLSPQTCDRRSEGTGAKRGGGVIDLEEYYQFIKILFKQPRKTILNNLRQGLKLPPKEIENQLHKLNISPDSRPANLSMPDINKLAGLFSNKRL